ncbi:hypothetical protein ACB098_12G126500 [Castanea mollissima]|uniref:Uncharacterized protein n=1 Tax=Castanea mollissima TaxID=60419 RepID=A0A8J4VH10_9ROSI|nr:hypothetical protein CMV_019115 [Castanea mollissima]
MRGIGGPLLCIGDLLSDLGESDDTATPHHETPLSSSPSSISSPTNTPQALDLTKLFQEDYGRLNEALSGTNHSWTALTLKLCSALETANELVQSTNSNARLLSEKVGELEKIVKKGDSAISSAKAIHLFLNQKQGPFIASQNIK